jgi:hypothetical protein
MLCQGMLTAIMTTSALVSLAQNTQQTSAANGELRYTAPAEWALEKPASKARVAQFKLPRAEGDKEDAQLVIYYFGPTEGGSASANIERWIGQMQQPEGDTAARPKTETFTANGLNITAVDVSGTYVAEMAPGSSEHHNDPNYRLRAAVIETPKGSYYLKLVGPQKTVEHWNKEIDNFLKSLAFSKSDE